MNYFDPDKHHSEAIELLKKKYMTPNGVDIMKVISELETLLIASLRELPEERQFEASVSSAMDILEKFPEHVLLMRLPDDVIDVPKGSMCFFPKSPEASEQHAFLACSILACLRISNRINDPVAMMKGAMTQAYAHQARDKKIADINEDNPFGPSLSEKLSEELGNGELQYPLDYPDEATKH